MSRKFLLVIEGDEGSYSAHLSELPAILITAPTIPGITTRAGQAVQLYLEEMGAGHQDWEIEVTIAG